MKKNIMKISVGLTAVAAMAMPWLAAHAAADPALVNAASDLSGSVKDNLLGTVFSTAFLTILAVVLVGFGIIAYVTRYVRKHTGR